MSALPAMERTKTPSRRSTGGSSMGWLDQVIVAISAVLVHLTLTYVFSAASVWFLRFQKNWA